ncbi:MAG: AMP-binding protein, partial [Deltaproteobacteria bacterium]|nr:AMP-binding protein [Deltaproteobacteria bacterium]
MLEGCVPFPEIFVKKYKEKGYWVDKTIGEEFDEFVGKYADRVALACNGEHVSYRELGERVVRLALHFIDRGLRPYDRMILQLPNEPEFVYAYFAAVKIGVIPILSLPAHRDAEITFFAQFTGARAHVLPARMGDFSHQNLSREVRKKAPDLQFTFVSGAGVDGDFISLTELLQDRIEDRVS